MPRSLNPRRSTVITLVKQSLLGSFVRRKGDVGLKRGFAEDPRTGTAVITGALEAGGATAVSECAGARWRWLLLTPLESTPWITPWRSTATPPCCGCCATCLA